MENRYDIIYGGSAPYIEHHFCREMDSEFSQGCFGTNPEHGFTWAQAVAEIIRWHRMQVQLWLDSTEEEYFGTQG